MRRRWGGRRRLSPQELVALAEGLPGFRAPSGTEAWARWLAALADHGVDAVDYLRARRLLRGARSTWVTWTPPTEDDETTSSTVEFQETK